MSVNHSIDFGYTLINDVHLPEVGIFILTTVFYHAPIPLSSHPIASHFCPSTFGYSPLFYSYLSHYLDQYAMLLVHCSFPPAFEKKVPLIALKPNSKGPIF